MATDRIKEPKYVITALNNLTGEREAVSKPHSRWKTETLLTKAMRDSRRHRKWAAYSLYRMEPVPQGTQLEIKFNLSEI